MVHLIDVEHLQGGKMLRLFLGMLLVSSIHAQAKVVKCGGGVEFNKIIEVENGDGIPTLLDLNGIGKKRVLFFNVFYAALYLEETSNDSATILNSDQLKVGMIHATRNITKKQLTDLFNDEFDRLCEDKCDKMRPAHDQFISYIRPINNGERLTLVVMRDRLEMDINGDEFFDPIHDPDYGDFLSRLLIGPDAADADLKKGLLGKLNLCR